jgi:predicted helicase
VYREQLFANEVMLLPYYIAALNIEHAHYERAGDYEQGQLQLRRCSRKDFQQEVFVPAANAAFHHDAVASRMLL